MVTHLVKKYFMDLKGSLLYSQEPVNGFCSEALRLVVKSVNPLRI